MGFVTDCSGLVLWKGEGSEPAVERGCPIQKTAPGNAVRQTLSGLSWSSEAEWALLTHETCLYVKVPPTGL